MQLPPADLAKLRTSLTEDVQTITQNYGNLKLAHSKYGQALEALTDITPENKGQTTPQQPSRSGWWACVANHCLSFADLHLCCIAVLFSCFSSISLSLFFLSLSLSFFLSLFLSLFVRQAYHGSSDFFYVHSRCFI